MRNLDEILNIHTEPFSDDILEDLYYANAYYQQATTMLDSLAAIIFLYYKKFDEQYGTSLAEGIVVEQIFPKDAYSDEKFIWREYIEGVMIEALQESGWSMHWLGTYIEELRVVIEEKKESKEAFHDAYKQVIDSIYEDGFEKSCWLKEEDEIREAGWLEELDMCLLWNSDLDRYNEYRRKNKNVVASICPKEDRSISLLEEQVWKPYVMWYVQKADVCEDRKYAFTILGCDGFSFCNVADINPNWIVKILKLGWLLQSALEKIDCYEAEKQRSKAA